MPAVLAEPVQVARIPHLSWSKIQLYLTCPRQFAYSYLEQAPQERVSASLVFGGAIHRAVETVHEARLAGLPLPTVEQLLAAYSAAWKLETRPDVGIEYARGEDAATLRGLAGRALEAYLEWLKVEGLRGKVIAIEHEENFELLPEAPPVKARLDLLELVGDELHVIDLKTSRCSWSEQKIKDAAPQLVIYSYAVTRSGLVRDLGVRRVVPSFVVVTKGARPKVQAIRPSLGQTDADRLKTQVAEVSQAIRTGVYVRREGWQCKGCPFRERCNREATCQQP